MISSTLEFSRLPLAADLIAELRSDHAGEHGAVGIYRGILAVTRRDSIRRFARSHLRAELKHRDFFDEFLPARHQSRLLPLWRAAGWTLGAVSAVFGARSVFLTIAAVESFVEEHYTSQVAAMQGNDALAGLSAKLEDFCAEEVLHRRDAGRRLEDTSGLTGRLWTRLVGSGSALGVAVARRV